MTQTGTVSNQGWLVEGTISKRFLTLSLNKELNSSIMVIRI
ncbi:MAG: hypothetical protein ABI416_14215 [Ginsengibacter sp.]